MVHRLSPAQFLALSFAALILTGAVLLRLPVAAAAGHAISVVDALFTSTSAVCVTGLIVLDTPRDLSVFGQVVVVLLIQAGGLGYMSISTVIATFFGRRLTLKERVTLQEALNLETMEDLIRFVFTVFKLTLAFELIGAVILAVRWTPEFGIGRAAYLGMFHAVSAFNNAGFSLFSDNLMGYRGDVTVNLVITTLIICGGIGFVVLSELGRLGGRTRLSLHAKLVLTVTALLIVAGTVGVFIFERANPKTLAPLGFGTAWLAAYFQSVTPRTAGFNTIDIGSMTAPGLFLLLVLMFIGASPGSTGGGVKTSTFGIIVVALWATVRGVEEPNVFGRRLPLALVVRSFFICLISFLAVWLVTVSVLIAEKVDLAPTLFETTSAFGTVGLSLGRPGSVLSLSGHFHAAGKLFITLMMFMGRVGPLTLAVAVARGRSRPRIRYPEGKVLIG